MKVEESVNIKLINRSKMKLRFHTVKLFLLFVLASLWWPSPVIGITLDKAYQPNQNPRIQNTVAVLNFNDTETSYTGIREKRQDVQQARTLDFVVGPSALGPAPLCFEREVYGTCRYRTAPDECFRHEWTAYATIVNLGYKKITSIPEGLIVHPGDHARVRVYLKSSCCNPIVQFIAWDIFLQSNACIVDVRELQDLHPGEIAGIVIGAILFFIIVIIIVALCLRRQRRKKLEKDTVIFGRSLTRSKSRSESMNRKT